MLVKFRIAIFSIAMLVYPAQSSQADLLKDVYDIGVDIYNRIFGPEQSAPEKTRARLDVSGYWHTDYGCTEFLQDGSSVSGSIRYDDGRVGNLSGTLIERTLTYDYGHSDDSGQGKIVFSPDGRSAEGRWKSEMWNKQGSWSLKKKSASC